MKVFQAFFSAVLASVLFLSSSKASDRTALDEYIAKPDSNYSFKLVKTMPGEGGTAYVLEMTSQQWLTEKEVDKPIWKHWLVIIKPDEVMSDTALLFIGGGSNDRTRQPSQDTPDTTG